MPQTSPRQRKTTGRDEFKHGALRIGRGGRGGRVKRRKQAIAIALSEAGASKYQSKGENKRMFAKAKRKESHGEKQEHEGKSWVGARGRRESTPEMGGKNGRKADTHVA
jgi:hypothetical protein